MGNTQTTGKQKPLIVVNNPISGFKKAVFKDKPEWEEVALEDCPEDEIDSFFLQWKNNDYTEGRINLTTEKITYFFTSDMSGCSLWYIYDKEANILNIRHEARPNSGQKHLDDGYTLIKNTNSDEITLETNLVGDVFQKTAQYNIVYAILDEGTITFKIQLVKLLQIGSDKKYSLVNMALKEI